MRLSVGVMTRMQEFTSTNEVPLGLNGEHGCLEGWMKDVALALQRPFKSVRFTDGREWWKCFVMPNTRRVRIGFRIEVG